MEILKGTGISKHCILLTSTPNRATHPSQVRRSSSRVLFSEKEVTTAFIAISANTHSVRVASCLSHPRRDSSARVKVALTPRNELSKPTRNKSYVLAEGNFMLENKGKEMYARAPTPRISFTGREEKLRAHSTRCLWRIGKSSY